jgi:hypothetical protein
MKTAKVSLTICAMILIAGILFTNPEVAGQQMPDTKNTYFPYAVAQTARPPVPLDYGAMPSAYAAPHDKELSELIKEESKAAGEASHWMKEYAGADNEAKRAKVKTKVQEALGKQFDAQQKRRDLELTRLEAQTKKLRELMKKRTDARTTIIEKRLDQLLREADGLGWASPHGPTIPGSYSAPRFAPLDTLPSPLQAK